MEIVDLTRLFVYYSLLNELQNCEKLYCDYIQRVN